MSTKPDAPNDVPHISQDLLSWLAKAHPNALPPTKFSDPGTAAMELAFRQGQQSVLNYLKAERERQERGALENVLNVHRAPKD